MITPTTRPRVLTGLRSNGDLTIANYLGAIHPMAELAKKYQTTHDFFMFVPDLHSFTTPINHDELYKNTINNVRIFVAAGAIDLKNEHMLVYRQSHVPAHSELTWILDCFAHIGELSRMTQFKDKAGLRPGAPDAVFEPDHAQHLNNESVSVGLFNYPVLMAADILLYGARYVPLGDDQKQHLELTRDLGLRLNEKFKPVFPDGLFEVVPEDWGQQLAFSDRDRGLRIRSLRNPAKKMSKSDADPAGVVSLTEDPAQAAKKIMAATTDSLANVHFDWVTQPGVTNLMQILAMLTQKDVKLTAAQWEGKKQYGELKEAVAKAVVDFLTGFQTKLATVGDADLIEKLEADEQKARAIAGVQLSRVQQAVGLYPRP